MSITEVKGGHELQHDDGSTPKALGEAMLIPELVDRMRPSAPVGAFTNADPAFYAAYSRIELPFYNPDITA